MKKIFLLILALIMFSCACQAAKIKNIEAYKVNSSYKVIFYTDTIPKFKTIKDNAFFRLQMFNTDYSRNSREIPSNFFRKLKVDKRSNSVDLVADYKYLTSSRIITYKNPNRIVVTFTRISNSPIKRRKTEITSVSKKSLKDIFKLTINLTGPIEHKIVKKGINLLIELPNVNPVIRSRKIKTGDNMVKKVAIDQVGSSAMLSIALTYPAYFKVYLLEAPYKLIVELDKKSKSTVSKKEVIPGLTYMRVVKGSKKGATYANVFLADPKVVDIFPYIPKIKEEENEEGGNPLNLFGLFGSEKKRGQTLQKNDRKQYGKRSERDRWNQRHIFRKKERGTAWYTYDRAGTYFLFNI